MNYKLIESTISKSRKGNTSGKEAMHIITECFEAQIKESLERVREEISKINFGQGEIFIITKAIDEVDQELKRLNIK